MFKHKYFYSGKIMCHSNFAVDIAKIYALLSLNMINYAAS